MMNIHIHIIWRSKHLVICAIYIYIYTSISMWACQGFLFSIIRRFGFLWLGYFGSRFTGPLWRHKILRSKGHDGFIYNIYVYYHIIYIWYVHVIWYIITFIWYICHISHIFVAFLWKIIGNKSIPFFVELVFRRLGLACWQLRFDPPCEISSQKSTLPLGERFDCWYPTGPTEGTPKKPEYSNSSSLTYLGVCCW